MRELQEVPRESLQFQSITVEESLTDEELRAVIDPIVGNDSCASALLRLGLQDPPGGSDSNLDAEVAARGPSIADLFGHKTFGTETSSPISVANSDENKRLKKIRDQRRLHADFHGEMVFANALHRMVDVHGRPDHETLTAAMTTEVLGAARGERFARAIQLFWDRQYDESAHVLVPRLESSVRDLARQDGLVISKLAQENRAGGVTVLGEVLKRWREQQVGRPLEGWFDYLEALLCDPLALNLRNVIAHGLRERIGRGDAALLIQAACWMVAVGELFFFSGRWSLWPK